MEHLNDLSRDNHPGLKEPGKGSCEKGPGYNIPTLNKWKLYVPDWRNRVKVAVKKVRVITFLP